MVYDNKARSRIGGLNPKILLAIFAVAITVTACSAERQSASHEPEGVSFEFRKLGPDVKGDIFEMILGDGRRTLGHCVARFI